MRAFMRVAVRRRVVVNIDDGEGSAIEGVLFNETGPLLVLKNATLLQAGRDPVRLDGDTIIERSRILFVQAP